MAKRVRVLRSRREIIGDFQVVHPDAAGVDAGSERHVVSVPEDRSEEPVRTFGTFTGELKSLAEWLISCGIKTVAIEATGVYWIPLFEILQQRGLNPKLIDSRSIGRRTKKTDVLDCQWIRRLHMHGLLDAAFRPSEQMLPLRALSRQRQMLIGYCSDHIRHMQKALDLMNVKLHLVVSDTVGKTGMQIIRAIVAGQHRPQELVLLRDPSCKRSEQDFVKALSGNYRTEHLFALEQAVDLFDVYQRKIADCDKKIAELLEAFQKRADLSKVPTRKPAKRRKNQPHFEAQTLFHQIAGVDLTAIPGLQGSSLLTILSETGTDMSSWNSAKHFAAWLALCSNNRITGGAVIRKHGPPLRPNRAAQAFRIAAQTLERSQSALGAFFRRIQARLGRPGAIKATAHKLALIFYSMLKNKTEFQDLGASYYEERYRDRLLNSLKKKALTLGFELAPLQQVH